MSLPCNFNDTTLAILLLAAAYNVHCNNIREYRVVEMAELKLVGVLFTYGCFTTATLLYHVVSNCWQETGGCAKMVGYDSSVL